MTSVSASDGGDIRGMARCGEPVVDGGADTPALDRRIAGPVMAGNQEQDPIAGRNRLIEAAVDRLPRAIKVHPVEVEGAIGHNRAAFETTVPAAVEGRSGFGFGGNQLRLSGSYRESDRYHFDG